jgi:hypothetical protein
MKNSLQICLIKIKKQMKLNANNMCKMMPDSSAGMLL